MLKRGEAVFVLVSLILFASISVVTIATMPSVLGQGFASFGEYMNEMIDNEFMTFIFFFGLFFAASSAAFAKVFPKNSAMLVALFLSLLLTIGGMYTGYLDIKKLGPLAFLFFFGIIALAILSFIITRTERPPSWKAILLGITAVGLVTLFFVPQDNILWNYFFWIVATVGLLGILLLSFNVLSNLVGGGGPREPREPRERRERGPWWPNWLNPLNWIKGLFRRRGRRPEGERVGELRARINYPRGRINGNVPLVIRGRVAEGEAPYRGQIIIDGVNLTREYGEFVIPEQDRGEFAINLQRTPLELGMLEGVWHDIEILIWDSREPEAARGFAHTRVRVLRGRGPGGIRERGEFRVGFLLPYQNQTFGRGARAIPFEAKIEGGNPPFSWTLELNGETVGGESRRNIISPKDRELGFRVPINLSRRLLEKSEDGKTHGFVLRVRDSAGQVREDSRKFFYEVEEIGGGKEIVEEKRIEEQKEARFDLARKMGIRNLEKEKVKLMIELNDKIIPRIKELTPLMLKFTKRRRDESDYDYKVRHDEAREAYKELTQAHQIAKDIRKRIKQIDNRIEKLERQVER